MRSTTTLVTLLATVAGFPAVLAAPLPAQVAAILSEVAAVAPAVVIDNRHYTPDGGVPASVALSSPRPIATAYLMGLATSTKVRVSALVGGVLAKEVPAALGLHGASNNVETVLVASDKMASTTPSDSNIPDSIKMESLPSHRLSETDVPCIYAQMRRDYNDMMVISLVAVFLLVIVAVELWDSSERISDVEAAPAGAIKLADEAVPEKQPLSVQASPVVIATLQNPASELAQ